MDQMSELEPVELSTIEEENSDQKTMSPGTASRVSLKKDTSYMQSNPSKNSRISTDEDSSKKSENHQSSQKSNEDTKTTESTSENVETNVNVEKNKHDKEENPNTPNKNSQPTTHGRLLTPLSPKSIPSDCIILKLMIVTGDSAEFIFNLKTPASVISEYVWSNWPDHWPESQKTARSETLRLIYQGRFLHGNVTLGALRLVPKGTSVMHLVHREKLPQAAPEDKEKDNKSGGGGVGNGSRSGDGVGNGVGESNGGTCPGLRRIARRIFCCMNEN